MATKLAGLNLCKAKLRESIGELRRTLDNKNKRIPPTRRLKLHLTLKKLEGVDKILGPIRCTSPLMTFDLPSVASARRRTTGKKR
jgi:hypothetical protein